MSINGEKNSEVRTWFARYVEMERAFDPALGDLYAEDAQITYRRNYPAGVVKSLTITGLQYRKVILEAMAIAKERNEKSTYTNIKYRETGEGMEISATRCSESRRLSSPYAVKIQKEGAGQWKITEELTVLQP